MQKRLGKHLASDVFESYSAGTETKPQINQDAVRIMKELYGIDKEEPLMIIGDWKILAENQMKNLR